MVTLSEARLRETAVAATGLFERIDTARSQDRGLEPTPEAITAVQSWKKAACGLDDDAFRRRLAWDGLSLDEVLRAFSTPPQIDALPLWTGWLNLFLRECEAVRVDLLRDPHLPEMDRPSAAGGLPFPELLIPIVRAARGALASKHGIAPGQFGGPFASALEGQLLREAALAAELALYENFTACRDERSEHGVSSDAGVGIYRRFIDEMLASGLAGFLARYPTLSRQLARLAEAWTEAVAELITRLERDRPAIARMFSRGESLGDVTWARAGISDRHDGRRAVALGFESGLSLVYKPRDVGLERALQQFIAWCVERGLDPAPKTIRILPGDAYGWVEYVEPGSLERVEPGRYYRRAGTLLCLLWVLGARDMHMENLVCTDNGPVVIDAETILQPEIGPVTSESGESQSCLGTGFLTLLATDPEGSLYDAGGLRGRGGFLAPLAERTWSDLGRDTMRFEERVRTAPDSMNRPVAAGRELPPEDFEPELIDGFTCAYRFLLEHRDEIVSETGPLRLFAAQRTRVLLRDSKPYAVLLYTLAQPDYQRNGLRRGLLIEALNRPHSSAIERPPLWPLVADERRALENMDIPRLTMPTTEAVLVASSGERVDRYFTRSGLAAAVERLAMMNEDDLRRQAAWLRTALANPVDGVLTCTPSPTSETSGGDPSDGEFMDSALWLGRELLQRARMRNGTLSWSYPGHAQEGDRDPGPVDLYDGAAGVALFLAALANVTGDASWGDAARAASGPLGDQLRRLAREGGPEPNRLGACYGVGSLIYSACWIARLIDDGSFLDLAVDAAQRLPTSAIHRARSCDVAGGTAGALLAFLTLSRHSGDSRALDMARACGEHLLQSRVLTRGAASAWPADDRRLLAGFAHGAAGISYALARLFAETGERGFLEAAAGGHRYERQLYSPIHRNWPILEGHAGTGEPMIVAWCHGAPGIGLARAAGFDVLGGELVLEEIRVGAEASSKAPLTGSDHLCCGNLGRADTLLFIGRRLGDDELVARAHDLSTRVARRASGRRRFGLPSSPYAHYVFIPGFFRGLSGIGYQLLRARCPSRLPSVLAFESDARSCSSEEIRCNELPT